jgi:hypothetical protein
MYSRHKAGATLYYYVKPEHVRPIEFLLEQKHDADLVYKTLVINKDANAQFFAVTPAKNGLDPVYKKYGQDNITLISQEKFGQLLVSEININNRTTSPIFRFNKSPKKTDRIFWKDVLRDVFGVKDDGKNTNTISGDE